MIYKHLEIKSSTNGSTQPQGACHFNEYDGANDTQAI